METTMLEKLRSVEWAIQTEGKWGQDGRLVDWTLNFWYFVHRVCGLDHTLE